MTTSKASVACMPAQKAVSFAKLQKLGRVDVAQEWAKKTVSNGMRVRQMMVWQPKNNKFFETLSFLPPLTDDEIAKQVDYITRNGWTPCLEFAEQDQAYVSSESTVRFGAVSANYFDNRYWTMFKLPMFGCSDPGQVLTEIANCKKSFPDAFVRLVAFDASRQVQVAGFLVSRPTTDSSFRAPADRSV